MVLYQLFVGKASVAPIHEAFRVFKVYDEMWQPVDWTSLMHTLDRSYWG
jgi:hypothetical protein